MMTLMFYLVWRFILNKDEGIADLAIGTALLDGAVFLIIILGLLV